jgi:hypothetical protein
MGKLISMAVTLAVLAISTGQLPRILKQVRIMQIKLIQESQASKWPKAMLLRSQ